MTKKQMKKSESSRRRVIRKSDSLEREFLSKAFSTSMELSAVDEKQKRKRKFIIYGAIFLILFLLFMIVMGSISERPVDDVRFSSSKTVSDSTVVVTQGVQPKPEVQDTSFMVMNSTFQTTDELLGSMPTFIMIIIGFMIVTIVFVPFILRGSGFVMMPVAIVIGGVLAVMITILSGGNFKLLPLILGIVPMITIGVLIVILWNRAQGGF